MNQLSLDVVAPRGPLVESHHRVHAAVVNAAGDLIGVAHDHTLVSPWRSCAKPFQIMPLLSSGGFDRIGWGDDHLAIACGSHGGEPEHVALAEAMLSSSTPLDIAPTISGALLSARCCTVAAERHAPHPAPAGILRENWRTTKKSETSDPYSADASRHCSVSSNASAPRG